MEGVGGGEKPRIFYTLLQAARSHGNGKQLDLIFSLESYCSDSIVKDGLEKSELSWQ